MVHICYDEEADALAEIEAKLKILDLHRPIIDADWPAPGHCLDCWDDAATDYLPWPCPLVRLLALPYADRDGYRPEWRPA